MTSRHGTKYRPSLSCSVCRRRKVRCGKEKPSCGNCSRMNEVCEYDRAPGAPGSGRNERSSVEGSDANVDIRVSEDIIAEASSSPSTLVHSTPSVTQQYIGSPSPSLFSKELDGAHPTVKESFPHSSDIRGFFTDEDKARPRFVDSSFWGYVPGEESTIKEFLGQEHKKLNSQFPIMDVTGLFMSVRTMPKKPISQALFSLFITGVRPLNCLIHETTLRNAFDSLFHLVESHLPDGIMLSDPTWICLIYSVLYCGALVAEPSAWATAPLKQLHRDTAVQQLSAMLFTSLEHAQYTKAPTFNTISALLLARSCAKKPTESPLEDVFFVSMVVRMAQTMGLHREDAMSKMNPVSRELGRRIWWHIRWLDVQVSVNSGSETSCGCCESKYDTKSIECNRVVGSGQEDCVPDEKSLWVEGPTSKIFTAGRFEVARFLWSMLSVVRELDGMETGKIVYLTDALNKFHALMDKLISEIPADGIPERGMIPSRIANASPTTHANLYIDNSNEPTVFGSWARIVLSISKSESAIVLYKLLLGRVDFSDEGATWEILVDYCLLNLRNFLQLVQTQAFTPYLWFSKTRCAPLQATNLSIMYLQRASDTDKRQQVRYFVDEVIDFYAPGVSKMDDGTFTATDTTPAAWRMLRTLRDKLDQQPINHQSLDDLATEALASSSNSSNPQNTHASAETKALTQHPKHGVLSCEDAIAATEVPAQEGSNTLATPCLGLHSHESCAAKFAEISDQFYDFMDEQ